MTADLLLPDGSIHPHLLRELVALRDSIRLEEGGGGMCSDVARAVRDLFGLPFASGAFVTPEDEPICEAHCWNVLPDGRILDVTMDQFGLAPPDAMIGDPVHYRPEWTRDYNPDHATHYPELAGRPWTGEEDALRALRLLRERGDGWWLADRTWLEAWRSRNRAFEEARNSPGLLLFHGTATSFDRFQVGCREGAEANCALGVHLTSHPAVAAHYAERLARQSSDRDSGRVLVVKADVGFLHPVRDREAWLNTDEHRLASLRGSEGKDFDGLRAVGLGDDLEGACVIFDPDRCRILLEISVATALALAPEAPWSGATTATPEDDMRGPA
ncbi:hypothetical protein LAZ40_04425 [Cereibacter sphaeroides]|uniref:hypothetical protein n=1 Tax=Cereibacter sphaeroides TaxID=1063 RepID=UPI001F2F3433|nr:hypothetical protein [Cereibacter sphaeroides]MCE6958301.1 hypothetical protein [Cereibacter sphaeroides]MCE6971911.1 hypothetical protein [Cereibacter sphaeroides]